MFSERITSYAWWLSPPPDLRPPCLAHFLPCYLNHSHTIHWLVRNCLIRTIFQAIFSLSLKMTIFTLCLNSETSSPPLDWHPLPLPHWQLHYCHFGDHWLDQSHPQRLLPLLLILERKVLVNQPTILWEEDTSKSCPVAGGVFLWQAGRENTWGQYFQLRQHEDGRKHTHFSLANISTWKISPLYQ